MKSKFYAYIIAFISIVAVSAYFRFLPIFHQHNNLVRYSAKKLVIDKLKQEISAELNESHPHLKGIARDEMINKSVGIVLRKNEVSIKKAVKKNYPLAKKLAGDAFSSFFLYAVDAYYYLGLVKNIMKNKTVSSSVKGGLYFNPFMLAPYGHWYYFDLHPYAGYYTYRLVRLFKKDISLMAGVSFTCPLLALLSVILFLIICFFDDINPLPAFMGSVFLSMAPIFFQRSIYGWFDTDSYNIIFPLLIFAFFFRALDIESNIHKRLIYILLSGISCGIYSMFWSGWIFIPSCVFLFTVCFSVYLIITKQHQALKLNFIFFGIYTAGTIGAVMLFRGIDGLLYSLTDTFDRISAVTNIDFKLWPDNFLTVGELKPPSLEKIAALCGGRLYFAVTILGIVFFLIMGNSKKNRLSHYYKISFLLSFIFIAILTSLNGGNRFTILMVSPLALCFSMFIDYIYILLRKIKGITSGPITIGILLLFTFLPISSARILSLRKQPQIYNKTWDNMMRFINKNTPENSIISTSWGPGHFITGVGRRRVTIDGATLEKPVGYWIARCFVTNDEDEARGILRMLNTSGNRATELLMDMGFTLSDAIGVLNDILPKSRAYALRRLSYHLTGENAQKLIALTHGTPEASYVLVYKDQVEKALSMQFIGNWDFKKAEDFKALIRIKPEKAKDIIKNNAGKRYVKLFWSIAGGPVFYEMPSGESRRDGNTVYFPNGLYVDLVNKDVSLDIEKRKNQPKNIREDTLKEGIRSLIYIENGKYVEKVQSESGKLSVILLRRGEKYYTIPAAHEFATSMLFRLYYLNGLGLKNFKPVHYEKSGFHNGSEMRLFEVVF